MKFDVVQVVGQAEQSLPSRERGLKFLSVFIDISEYKVAPFTGAWIEIFQYTSMENMVPVAPFTGAWIEICRLSGDGGAPSGRSLHGSVD